MNARKMTIGMGVIAAILLAAGSAQATISGINSPTSSYASIYFDDTNSLTPSLLNGTTYSAFQSPWNGSSYTMSSTIDPNTLDEAKGNLLGTCIPGTGTYAVSLNSVRLTQAALNTGYADLSLRFDIEYQLDSAGLPNQPTLFPNFTVDGTVQNSGVGFANFKGSIDYYGTDAFTNLWGLIDTVTYPSTTWNTPGPFNGTVAGTASNGWTTQLAGGTTLTLIGNFYFTVDPATMNVETVVPEPGTLSLLVLAGLALGGRVLLRRRCKA